MKLRAGTCRSPRFIRRRFWWVAIASSVALVAVGVTFTARGEGGGPRYFAITHPPGMLGPEGRPGTSPWRAVADEIKTDDKRIETWRSAGFTTTLTVPEGGILPGQAAVLNLAGNRAGDYVVRVNATVPVSFKPVGGF